MSDPLPPRSSSNEDKERVFRTALKGSDFVKFEREASERGITAYKLSQIVLTMYLNKQLLTKEELNQEPNA